MSVNLKSSVVPEHLWGVCLWEVGGLYVGDDDGFLSMEGMVGDKDVERKMAEAARYWMDTSFAGKPTWLPGSRQISSDELDDQEARLRDGYIPDEVDEIRQAVNRRA